MNTLSWLLYSIDVISSASAVLTFFVVILFSVLGFYFLMNIGMAVDNYLGEDGNHKFPYKHLLFFVIPIFLTVVLILLPSKETMYAIAASEVGEEALKSEIGQKAQQAISNWIDSQLDTEK